VVLFSAKYANSKVKIVSSASPDQLCAILTSKNFNRSFEFVGIATPEKFVCQVGSVQDSVSYHKYIVMELSIGEQQHQLHSKLPTNAGGGKYTLNFGGKFTKSSIRNAILIDENDQTAILVRRIGKEDLEVECFMGLSNLVCFGFALVSWLCPH
jgi:hypothetical protein